MGLTKAEEQTILVYVPAAEEASDQYTLAQRLPTLEGKMVGLLDNTKDLADTLLGEVKSLLQEDFPKAEFRYFRKESVNGAAPELIEELATCDAVVTAVGD